MKIDFRKLKSINLNFQFREYIIVLLIISLGFYLRFYNSNAYPLGFDQVQILTSAESIKTGHMTLIGPRTGPANMFTGPLIYYITAILLYFIPSPYAIVATAICIYLITSIIVWLVLRRSLAHTYVWPVFVFYVFSPLIIYLDRTPWNPNLSFLSGSLVFFPLINIVKTKEITFSKLITISLGLFLSYQAHFSGFFLLLLTILFWIIFIRKKILLIPLLVLSFLLSILPTILFDNRHNFLNLRGFLNFIQTKTSSYESSVLNYIWQNFLMTTENLGKILVLGNSRNLYYFVGSLVFVLFIYLLLRRSSKESRSQMMLMIAWILSFVVFFAFYRGSIPEYYYLMQFPALIYMISVISVSYISSHSKRIFLFTVFILFSYSTIKNNYANALHNTIGNQIALKNFILQNYQKLPVSELRYDMEMTDQDGLRYLLKNIRLDTRGYVYHLAYPHSSSDLSTYCSGDLCTWIDPRVKNDKRYLELKKYIIEVPQNYLLLEDYTHRALVPNSRSFMLLIDHMPWGEFLITDPVKFENFYPEIFKIITDIQGKYIQLEFENTTVYGRYHQNTLCFLWPYAPVSQSGVDQIGNEIIFYTGRLSEYGTY